jgi:DNA-directed RNA polymerase II subunit RPB1
MPYANEPEVKRVRGVQFGLLSPEETRSYSVVKILHPECFVSRKPRPHGLLDPRMGPVDFCEECVTCGQENGCPGHFGHIELAKPVFHIRLFPRVIKLLRCVCPNCSRMIIHDDAALLSSLARKPLKIRLADIDAACSRRKTCAACGFELPKAVRREPPPNMLISFDGKEIIDAEKALQIITAVPEEDLNVLGFSTEWAHPAWFIVTVVPVPPPTIRLSVYSNEGRSEDDLTHKLADIIKANRALEESLRKCDPKHITDEFVKLLQFHHATLITNTSPQMQRQATSHTGRPLKSIEERIKGKTGRIRGNIMGKRVDFSARTVITPDPNLGLREIGMPVSVAMTLSFPESVTEFNIEAMREAVARGPQELGGANMVIRPDGQRYNLGMNKGRAPPEIREGWVVHRHLRDGDMVLFNRQPSLHKMSIMAHEVKIVPYSTFRLNLSATTPYNADFDGDEMNVFVPQNIPAATEARELMSVHKCIVSAQSNKPVMSIVQDALLGSRSLSSRDVFLERAEAMTLVCALGGVLLPAPAILRPVRRWTGKQIIQMYLPPITFRRQNSTPMAAPSRDPDLPAGDELVLIRAGEYVCGQLDKRALGANAGGIIHLAVNDFGDEATARFIDCHQRVVNQWLLLDGASIGLGDAVASPELCAQVEAIVDESMRAVAGMVNERDINRKLNECRDLAGALASKSLPESNNFKAMVHAGSKGSAINLSQILGVVGQQNVEGQRVPLGFRNRALPHYTQHDRRPEARGFVRHSYIQGLTPSEMFFHALGGREGLTDTALKTAQTGYIARKLMKGTEALIISHSGAVVNAENTIIQFSYSGGYCGSRLEQQKLDLLELSDAEVARRYDWGAEARAQDPLLDAEFARICELRTELLSACAYKIDSPSFEGVFTSPVNIERVLARVRIFQETSGDAPCTPNELVQLLPLGLLHSLESAHEAILRTGLHSKRVFGLGARAIRAAWRLCEESIRRARVQPGEMVGAVAAQSIAEPATQMTLRTFHLAGVSSKNVTLGVPRLQEILNATKNCKTPGMTVRLLRGDEENAKRVRAQLEYLRLSDLCLAHEVAYDPMERPPPHHPKAEADRRWADELPGEFVLHKLSPWMIRFELDAQELATRDVSALELARRVQSAFGEEVALTNVAGVISGAPALHVRAYGTGVDDMDLGFVRELARAILATHIRGCAGVKRTLLRETKRRAQTSDWLIETEGTDLLAAWAHDAVDFTRTVCNDPIEMSRLLGVEAGRASLRDELVAVLEFDGAYVDHRHILLLVDAMTNMGSIQAVSRHGINRGEKGVFAKASFEQSVDVLFEASMNGNLDACRDAAAATFTGQLARIGTGSFKLLYRVDAEEEHPEGEGDVAPDGEGEECTASFSPSHPGYCEADLAYSPTAQTSYSPMVLDQQGWAPPSPSYSPMVVGGWAPPSPSYSPSVL